MGEVDVLKRSNSFLESKAQENSGFYVRGGGPDQNLVLLDNVLFITHLTYLVSSQCLTLTHFQIDVHKGALPQIRGRISSVLDIGLKGKPKRL